jgi:putative ABC transport system substrate-binding protein
MAVKLQIRQPDSVSSIQNEGLPRRKPMLGIRRREVVTLLAGAAAAWPLGVRAQQRALPILGVLGSGSREAIEFPTSAFLQGLGDTGYVVGRDVAIEYRWGDGQQNLLRAMAADLVQRRAAAIVTFGSTPAAEAAKAASSSIPIVFVLGSDPVAAGLVRSLERPGGNVTGVLINSNVTAKRLGLLHEVAPGAARFALLVNPATPYDLDIADARAAAAAIGGQIEVVRTATSREIDAAFASLVRMRANALLVNSAVFFSDRRVQIVTLAARHAVPAIYYSRVFTDAGGLMSYGSSIPGQVRQAGVYVGRILKGEKPADLPVLPPTRYEFVINLQAAKMQGIAVPPSLRALATEVIE